MRGLNNYKNISEYTDNVKLPVGAYEIKIIRAEERSVTDGNGKERISLCLVFDISDGEYKDYYMNKFNTEKKANYPDLKYKGVFRLEYPNGGEYDESNEKRMKTALERLRASNMTKLAHVDFSKEWDGAVLKDCKAGLVFREQEYNFRGNTGMTTQPYQLITLDALKENKFTIPAPKYLNGNAPQTSSYANPADIIAEDDDLPF